MKAVYFYLLMSLVAEKTTAQVKRDSACAAQDATEFALIYGEPLLSYEKTFKGRLQKIGLNQMLTTTSLASPTETATVKPNLDTLYMSQCYDLSSDDITLKVGNVSDRFFSASFYTPYGDNYLTFGSLNAARAGKYLLTPTNTTQNSGTLGTSVDPNYEGVVYAPTTIGFLLIRILVKDRGDDLKRVQGLQHGFSTELVSRNSSQIGPTLNVELFRNSSNSQAGHLLSLTSRFAKIDASLVFANQSTLLPQQTLSNLSTAGVGAGSDYKTPDCVDLAAASQQAVRDIQSYTKNNMTSVGNGWVLPRSNAIGVYGTDYTARSSVARWGYLAMTENTALYPSYKEDFSLQSNESYILRFSRKPPIQELGFWSLTLYDSSGFLVSNSMNRYATGDRDNLTFSDGQAVYGSSGDGPFDVLIQSTPPTTNWTSNWLPSPPEAGNFDLLLRFYGPQEGLTNGSYVYPVIEKQAAIQNTTVVQQNNASLTKHFEISFVLLQVFVLGLLSS